MKYETPRLTALMPAINAIESLPGYPKGNFIYAETIGPIVHNESDIPGYEDWE